jgi:hypothetical protein
VPLSKDTLWSRYVEKNPHWLTEGVTLTPAGLRKLFEQTYEMGHAQGLENGKALASHESLFGRMFGKP